MYSPSNGPAESATQVRELDDTFLASDPLTYFTARALMLRSWLDSQCSADDGANPSAEIPVPHQVEVHSALHGSGPVPALAPLDVEGQVALDAFSLRHQAAEALARLAVATLERTHGSSTSLWSGIADGPRQIEDLAQRLAELVNATDAVDVAALLLPPQLGKDAYSYATSDAPDQATPRTPGRQPTCCTRYHSSQCPKISRPLKSVWRRSCGRSPHKTRGTSGSPRSAPTQDGTSQRASSTCAESSPTWPPAPPRPRRSSPSSTSAPRYSRRCSRRSGTWWT